VGFGLTGATWVALAALMASRLCLRACCIGLAEWVPLLTAEPLPPVIGISADRALDPELTPAQARQLAGILVRLSDKADAHENG
jgi:hypothetical protein